VVLIQIFSSSGFMFVSPGANRSRAFSFVLCLADDRAAQR
jgi:hypothetical protein